MCSAGCKQGLSAEQSFGTKSHGLMSRHVEVIRKVQLRSNVMHAQDEGAFGVSIWKERPSLY